MVRQPWGNVPAEAKAQMGGGGGAEEVALLRLAVRAPPSGCPTHTWRRWALAQEEVGDEGDRINSNTGGVDTCRGLLCPPHHDPRHTSRPWFLQRLGI